MAKNNWTEYQLKAINKRDSNILVSASAGSGKTAVLVERIIQKVVNEFLDVDKILVVTFTNAAAQELKEKILNAIYKALEDEKDTKKIVHLKNQLVRINRANITTIDAFCYRLVKENFNVLDVDPNIRICEESQALLIKSRVLEDLLEKEYENYAKESNVFGLYNILELFDGNEEMLLEYVINIHRYIQSFPYPFKWLKEQIEKYNIEENKDLYDTDFGRDIYNEIMEELNLIVLRYEDNLDKIRELEEFNKAVEILEEDKYQIKMCIDNSKVSWDRLYEEIQKISFGTFRVGTVSDEDMKKQLTSFRNGVKKSIDNIIKKVYGTSKQILEDNRIGYKYMNYLYDFILSFDNNFKLEKKKLAIAEFNDIMHYALELLIDEEDNLMEIALSLKSRFKEVYTDEYQDTSYVQERILDAVSKDSNRFMVGDIKQSIYGFRQARPDIFNDKYISYPLDDENNNEDSCKIILSKNFRSRKEVIYSINYIFEKIMSMKNGQCNYDGDETLKCGNKSYIDDENLSFKTEINIIDLKDKNELPLIQEGENEKKEEIQIDEELSKTEIEARCIAAQIESIIQNVMVQDGTALRKATYRDIVILLRSVKEKAQIIEKTLKDNNIPVFSDTSASIFEGDEVKLVLSFLKILDNPYNDVEITSIMYSIIGGFTLNELTKIRLYNNKDYIIDTLNNILMDDEFIKENSDLIDKINIFLELLNLYTNYSKIYTIPELLTMLYKDTNIYYQLALEENSNSKIANLDYLIELASNFNTQVGNTLNSYIKYVDNLKDKIDSSSGTAKIIGENENVVRIMTIHKSKGLEFPIVILADTSKGYNFMDIYANKIVYHHKYGIGIDIVNSDYGIRHPSVIKESIKNVLIKETKSEEIRLLYVALTRAKEKLYIFATSKDYKKELEAQLVSIEDGKLNEVLITSADSYYKLLLPVIKYLYTYEDNSSMISVNLLNVSPNTTDEKIREMLGIKDISDERHSLSERMRKILEHEKIVADDNTIKKIKDNVEYQYPYIEDTKTSSRISVSNLKKLSNTQEDMEKQAIEESIHDEILEYTDEGTINKQEKIDFKLPDMLNIEDKYTAVRKGILTHFILQNLDFNVVNTKADIKDYISILVSQNIISKKDSKYISINHIYNFLNSMIGKELKEAKEIYKEFEFILDDKNFSNSLIQGVIDLFYVTKDNRVILVDFKTDKLTDESLFIKRYKIQLDIYKQAINTLTEYKVDNTYIYSFNLNKEIELEEKNE